MYETFQTESKIKQASEKVEKFRRLVTWSFQAKFFALCLEKFSAYFTIKFYPLK